MRSARQTSPEVSRRVCEGPGYEVFEEKPSRCNDGDECVAGQEAWQRDHARVDVTFDEKVSLPPPLSGYLPALSTLAACEADAALQATPHLRATAHRPAVVVVKETT